MAAITLANMAYNMPRLSCLIGQRQVCLRERILFVARHQAPDRWNISSRTFEGGPAASAEQRGEHAMDEIGKAA